VEYFDKFDTETLNSVGIESNIMLDAMVKFLWFVYHIYLDDINPEVLPKFSFQFAFVFPLTFSFTRQV
jgi:hypothetical protein